jgi:response regulator RpfG family c-di-GMP phosphodiesterase
MTERKLWVMLVDDDDSTNELHKIVLDDINYIEGTIVFDYAEKALDYLSEKSSNALYIKPDIIFLDLNMPRMNGWEFLDEYNKLPNECTVGITIFLLTTSLNPDDKLRATKYEHLAGYYNKPLCGQILQEVVSQYFTDRSGTT